VVPVPNCNPQLQPCLTEDAKLVHHGRKEDVWFGKQLKRFEGLLHNRISISGTIFYLRYVAAVINLQVLEPRKDADAVEGLDRDLRFDLGISDYTNPECEFECLV
jgi:hypothetical protein